MYEVTFVSYVVLFLCKYMCNSKLFVINNIAKLLSEKGEVDLFPLSLHFLWDGYKAKFLGAQANRVCQSRNSKIRTEIVSKIVIDMRSRSLEWDCSDLHNCTLTCLLESHNTFPQGFLAFSLSIRLGLCRSLDWYFFGLLAGTIFLKHWYIDYYNSIYRIQSGEMIICSLLSLLSCKEIKRLSFPEKKNA